MERRVADRRSAFARLRQQAVLKRQRSSPAVWYVGHSGTGNRPFPFLASVAKTNGCARKRLLCGIHIVKAKTVTGDRQPNPAGFCSVGVVPRHSKEQ